MEDCAIAVALELQKQGFTIARAEPSAETEGIRHSAVADYLLDHKGLRPAMTDAELEREVKKVVLPLDYPANGFQRGYLVHEIDVINLVKKYRGK